jgi:hypothetical protein
MYSVVVLVGDREGANLLVSLMKKTAEDNDVELAVPLRIDDANMAGETNGVGGIGEKVVVFEVKNPYERQEEASMAYAVAMFTPDMDDAVLMGEALSEAVNVNNVKFLTDVAVEEMEEERVN